MCEAAYFYMGLRLRNGAAGAIYILQALGPLGARKRAVCTWSALGVRIPTTLSTLSMRTGRDLKSYQHVVNADFCILKELRGRLRWRLSSSDRAAVMLFHYRHGKT